MPESILSTIPCLSGQHLCQHLPMPTATTSSMINLGGTFSLIPQLRLTSPSSPSIGSSPSHAALAIARTSCSTAFRTPHWSQLLQTPFVLPSGAHLHRTRLLQPCLASNPDEPASPTSSPAHKVATPPHHNIDAPSMLSSRSDARASLSCHLQCHLRRHTTLCHFLQICSVPSTPPRIASVQHQSYRPLSQ